MENVCDISTPESRVRTIQMLLNNKVYLTGRKFRDFVVTNLPELFWAETEDDAKPDYYDTFVGPGEDGRGELGLLPSDKTINNHEKIEKGKLKKTLDEVYKARSRLVHEGRRLPSSIITGHFRRIPFDAVAEIIEQKDLRELAQINLPPFITLERLVSYTLVEFLRKQEQN